MTRHLLVTGGAGFIGSNFVRYLLREYPQDIVTNLDKLTYAGTRETLSDLEGNPRHRFIEGDIADSALVERLLNSSSAVDAVVNFAAESHVDRSIVDPAAFLQTNVIGTQVLLEAARRHTPRPAFLQISTDEVYGSIDHGTFTEDSLLAPNSPYAASKAAADLLAFSYQTTHGMTVVVTRSSNNYGPYQFPEKFIPLAITHALEDIPIPLYGDGLNVRDWIHVEDNCRGIDQVLQAARDPDPHHRDVYNIGGGEERTNLAVLKTILNILGKPESLIQPVADRPGHDRRYALSTERLRQRTPWRSRRTFEEGLRQTVRWYQEHADWWQRLKARQSQHWLSTTKGAR